jgi:hypothetical protein
MLQETLDPRPVDQGIFNQFAYILPAGAPRWRRRTCRALAALLDDARRESAKGSRGCHRSLGDRCRSRRRDNDTGFGVINPRGACYGIGLAK